MKSTVEKLSPTRVKMTVEVPYEELKPSIDAALSQIGQQIQVPGFRKGKVPARIIEQRVGRGAVLQEAINESLPEFYARAAQENDVRPMGQPEVDITSIPAEGEGDFVFTAEVDVRPEFDLPDTSTFKVEVDPIEVSDADVDEQLDGLRQRFGTLVGVDRAVKDGDFVSIDLKATIGDEEIDSVNGVSYEVGSGNMLPGLDEALVGMKAGESKEFNAPLAGGEHEGEEAVCEVTVESVKERELPEADDEFAQMASEFDTLDELKEQLVKNAEQQKRFGQGIQARDKVLEQLLAAVDIELPQSVIDAEVNSHLEGEGRQEDDEHRAEVAESTKEALKTQLILDKLVEENEIQVSQEELIEYLIMTSQQYGMDPNQFAQMLDQQGQVPAIMGEVARRKALASILENVEVKDTNGEPVDLNAVVEGTEDDDEAGDLEADMVADADTDADGDATESGAEDKADKKA